MRRMGKFQSGLIPVCRKIVRCGWRTMCFLLALFTINMIAPGASAETVSSVGVLVNGLEKVNLWVNEAGDAYVFLPSFADPASTMIYVEDGSTVLINGIQVETGMDCSAFPINRPCSFSLQGGPEKQVTFLQSENIASLFITTDEHGMDDVHADKKNKVDAGFMLYAADGATDYSGSPGDQIKGRGNSTWELDKKPYNMKLRQPADLLGMGPGQKWALLANAYDETNLRNKIVLDFAREIGPYDGFAPECAFVDVYANGEYMGLYLMCRSVDDVTEEFLGAQSDDGYEIELTMAKKLGEDDPSLSLNPAMSVEIVRPSPCTDAQKARLQEIISALDEWFRTDAPLPSGLHPDFDSWARKALIEIIFENYDSPNASQFFWGSLKDGTIFAGPCWDYDLSMGIFYINWSTPYAFMTFKDWNLGQDISWYHGMWEKHDFQEFALKLYQGEFHDPLNDLLDRRISSEAEAIASAAGLDRARWPGLYTKHETFPQAVEDMILFMHNRVQFLDSFWQDPAAYRLITMKLPNTRMLHLYVKAGTVCEDLPLPCTVSLEGEGMEDVTTWYVEGTDEPFDTGSAITEDIVLYAILPEQVEN